MTSQSSLIADQWQTIDSAPKRGHILLALPSGVVHEGWWGVAKYNRKTKAYDEAFVISPYSGDVKPTHGMPLPSPPRALDQKGSSNDHA